jgi:glycosyltransferase involved in cell wall biosynthesis
MTPLHRRLGRFLNYLVTGTLANCEAARQAVIVDERPAPETVLVLENGVDLDPFRHIAQAGFINPPGKRRIGVVANLRPVKGLLPFVEAAAQVYVAHPGVTFHVVGEGDFRPTLEQRARELGLDGHFQLPGSSKNVPAFLSSLDIAVLPSFSEGMSNAILEYMAAGRAIVATSVGATVQLIEDGVHGLLVPPGKPQFLANAIIRLLDDPKLAERLGTAARNRAWHKYSREAMVRRFESFYRNLVLGGSLAACGV